MASSGLRKMLINYFPTQDGVTVLVCPVSLWTLKYIVVIFYDRCYAMFLGMWYALAGVIANLMTDVIAMLCVVDVTTTTHMV